MTRMLSLRRSPCAQRAGGLPHSFRPTLEVLEDRWLLSNMLGLYRQTDLVSDQPGVARLHDPTLVNAWGIALNSAGGAFWVSARGTGVSPLYSGDVNGSALTRPFGVVIPGGAPTGQVFNGTGQFTVTAGTASASPPFIFASDTGFITGWSPVVPAAGSRVSTVAVNKAGVASYTGLAIGNNGTANFLYAADFKNGKIDVFTSTYAPGTLSGNFTDPGIPKNFAPFNIQNLDGKLYVTYARQSDRDTRDLKEHGTGFVSVFDLNGNFLRRLGSRGHLKSPWGLALAPADFGKFSGALLVGNHGDGRISAFDRATGEFLGQLRDEDGGKVRIDGLWGLAFGNGVTAGDANALYFTAGPDDGRHGLFGSLRAVDDTSDDGDMNVIMAVIASQSDRDDD